jgi:hypothetical protein
VKIKLVVDQQLVILELGLELEPVFGEFELEEVVTT